MKYIVLLSFLGSTLTAPWQIPHPLQSIIKQQMFQPSQETIQHVTLLEQLQRIQQQIAMQAEMQMQQQRVQQQIPLLLPLQGTVQQQRLALQEQMFALQQFQELQRMNYGPPTLSM